MASINRYDTPAQAQFINTYVPIPFDQMMKVGAMKQQMVEENDKLTDETLGALSSIKVAPADEQAYIAIASKMKNEINDIMNNSQPGSYEGKRKLMNLRNSLATNSDLREMVQNYGVYSDAMTQKQEADKAGTISANMGDLNDVISNLSSGGKGTLGRRKETGSSGVYSKGSWMENVDVYKAMEQRVNDVEESVVGQAGIVAKDGNKYILTQETAGKSLNALGAPLGISFSRNEKGEMTIDLTKSNISMFLSTPEGRQLKNIAREKAQGNSAKYTEILQKEYYDQALAAINERVSNKSTVKLSADPFDEARYKKELEDKTNPWSTPLSIATSGSKLVSFNKTQEAKTTIDNQIATEKENFKQFNEIYGIKDVVTTDPKTGQTTVSRMDKNGIDVSEAYDLKAAQIKQLEDQKQSIDDMVKRVKDEVGIPQTWEPDARVKELAEDKRNNAERAFLYKATMAANREATPEEKNTARALGQDAYDKYIVDKDPTWGKLNKALAANAAKSSVITTATKFGSKEMNEKALAEFPLLMENEVQDVGTKKSLTVKEKEALGAMSAGKGTATDPTRVVFGGSLVDPESQKIKFVYQTYDKNGKLSDPFMVDAPEGAVNDLIASGATDKAKVMIHQQLSRLETNPDNTTTVTLGTGSQATGTVRKTSVSGDHLKPKWLLTVNLSDGPTEKVFDSRTALIDYYEAYVMTEMKKRQK